MDSNVLFERKTVEVKDEIEESDGNDDMWDDTLLIKAYERAISLAKRKVNSKSSTPIETGEGAESKKESKLAQDVPKTKVAPKCKKSSKSSYEVAKTTASWKVGMPCRSVYHEDGEIYEGTIVKMFQWKGRCVVRYFGYNNEEEVDIEDLMVSLGESARQTQMLQFMNETSLNMETDEIHKSSEPEASCGERGQQHHALNNCVMMPPPSPYLLSNLPKTESEALSSMLISWYMNGYHTGYYQAMKNLNQSRSSNQFQSEQLKKK